MGQHETFQMEVYHRARFSPYGDLIEHWDCHHEKAQPLQWPGTEASDFHNNLGSLEQEFRLTWIPKASSSKQKLYFEGLHDSYNYMNDTDAGIEYSPEKDEYSIHLISTRPDGTYYIHALKPETTFIMAFALPNPENGEPIKETLKAFYFHGDEAVHLHAGVWHSLPILEYRPNGSAEFKEIDMTKPKKNFGGVVQSDFRGELQPICYG
uniref:Ureidoglycolate hydrolase n=1 Tax=Acrobeloides nanus TaxID=290746 RepID=A0A914BVU8_9BILA